MLPSQEDKTMLTSCESILDGICGWIKAILDVKVGSIGIPTLFVILEPNAFSFICSL